MIRFPCPKCRKALKAPDGSEGRKTRCPWCQHPLCVPLPVQPADDSFKTANFQSFLNYIGGGILIIGGFYQGYELMEQDIPPKDQGWLYAGMCLWILAWIFTGHALIVAALLKSRFWLTLLFTALIGLVPGPALMKYFIGGTIFAVCLATKEE